MSGLGPVLASVFVRNAGFAKENRKSKFISSLKQKSKQNLKENNQQRYHWYSLKNMEPYIINNEYNIKSKRKFMEILSLISTRFIGCSWPILKSLEIAPPKRKNDQKEWILVEIVNDNNNYKSVACIRLNSSKHMKINEGINMDYDNPFMELSPLVIHDLKLPLKLNNNNNDNNNFIRVCKEKNVFHNMKLGFKTIDYYNLCVAKTVFYQIISSNIDDDTIKYNEIIREYLLYNKCNDDVIIMKNNFHMHHKCIWKNKVIPVPILWIKRNFKRMKNGKKSLKEYLALKSDKLNSNFKHQKYQIKKWIYVNIIEIRGLNNTNDEYYRILPTMTEFEKIEVNGQYTHPKLVELYTHMYLNKNQQRNDNNIHFHYKLPAFYQNLYSNILFPSINHKSIKVLPTFLISCNKGHNLSENYVNFYMYHSYWNQ